MNPESFHRSLEAHQAHYARMFRPSHEQARFEQKRLVAGIARQIAELEHRLHALEAWYGYEFTPAEQKRYEHQYGRKDDFSSLDNGGFGRDIVTGNSGDSGSDDSSSDDSSDDSGGDSGGGHYNPMEPRIPAGNTGGGEWTTGGELTDSGGNPIIDPNTGLPYPKPSGLDMQKNIAMGEALNPVTGLGTMISWFEHSGLMDYQRADGGFNLGYTNVSNYNFGVVSAAVGYSETETLTAAGIYNIFVAHRGTTQTVYGLSTASENNIKQGWSDYKSGKFSSK